MRTEMPIALSIAGSDSGGGAGIQADLKTFAALGVHGCTAITAITAQDTRQVHRVLCLDPDLVGAQIAAIRGDFPVAATKLGMLGNATIIDWISKEVARGGLGKVVLDPVMVAASGATLLEEGAVAILREELLPQVDLLTPNLPEASMLLGRAIADEDGAVEAAAEELRSMGAKAILLKAGHRRGNAADDLLMLEEGPVWLRAARLEGAGAHGTGCSLSAAIAAFLARGQDLQTACTGGKEYVRRGMEEGLRPGKGEGILHHFWEYYGREGLP